MGRPKKAEGEKVLTKSVTMTPGDVAFLVGKYGGVSDGVRLLIEAARAGVVPGTAVQSAPPTGQSSKAYTHGPVVQRTPPSGEKCKSPWKCGRGQAACQPCKEAASSGPEAG